MRIGILAVQGCVEPHHSHLEKLGVEMVHIRYPEDCANISGYIIPGGESTTMLKLIRINELQEKLASEWKLKPVWGICAGAILIAQKVTSPEQFSFGLIDYEIARNAYGSQIMSHYGEVAGYKVAFIRAPKIMWCNPALKILATHSETPAWVANDKVMATTFHPELNNLTPSPMHRYFVENYCANV